MDEQESSETVSREFVSRVMEFSFAMGTLGVMYWVEHPTEFRIQMTKALRSLSNLCTNQSIFWIRQANRLLDASDRFKL